MVPLFGGVPGGPEMLVILLVLLVMFGIPLVLIVVGIVGWKRFGGRDDTVEELETRVAELERELEEERADEQSRD